MFENIMIFFRAILHMFSEVTDTVVSIQGLVLAAVILGLWSLFGCTDSIQTHPSNEE